MKIIDITNEESWPQAIKEAIEVLKQGGTIVYPTDTVYVVSANACEDAPVRMIYRIKDRPKQKPLPVFVRNMAWAKEVAFVPPKLESKFEELWPGAITIVLPVKKVISKEVTQGHDTVGLRIPDYPFIDRLLAKYGYPLAQTSANISSEEGSDDPDVFLPAFKENMFQPDLVLSVGKLPESKPSTIIDFSTIQPRILRVGMTKPDELAKILNIELK